MKPMNLRASVLLLLLMSIIFVSCVGTCRLEQIPEMLQSLRNALKDLN